jgi:PadR family transcriptional regulator PadR
MSKYDMSTQLKKGLLEVCVLRHLSQGDSYGYEIINELKSVADMSESTLYSILKRLVNDDCLTTYSKECGGRLRKYYSITKQGAIKLEEFKGGYAAMMTILNYVLGGTK